MIIQTPYQIITLHRIYMFGIFPKLYCLLRTHESDGTVIQKRIAYKIRRFGDYPEYNALLDVVINNIPQSYIIDNHSYAQLNFRDKPVSFMVGKAEPYLQFH